MDIILKEKRKHGDVLLPFYIYDLKHSSTHQVIIPLHWHEEIEIIYMAKGEAQIRAGDTSILVTEGEAVMVNSEALHSATSTQSPGTHMYAIVFHLSFLSSGTLDACQSLFILPMLKKELLLPIHIHEQGTYGRQIASLLRNLISVFQKKEKGYELALKGYLLLILSKMAGHGSLISQKPVLSSIKESDMILLKKAIDYISQNYHQRIELQQLALLVNMSRYSFCRFFKKHTNMSPIDYVNMYRIHLAERMLLTGSCNVTEAAIQTGFEHMSHFTKLFKRYTKRLPSEVKRSQKKQPD